MEGRTSLHRFILFGSFIGTQLVMLWVLLGPSMGQEWWRGFRGYFANDQLSYAAIAISVANGNNNFVEPLTETGTSHYPSAWYFLIGLVSRFSSVPVYVLWIFLGLLAIGGGLIVLGWLGYRFSDVAWAPLLPGIVLLTGTLSMQTENWWFTPLTNHAVVWGPFGTFYTLNAEAIGLMILSTAVGLLLLAATDLRWRFRLVLIAAVMLGGLANVQTYVFLTGTSFVAIFIATLSLLKWPSRKRLVLTLFLLSAFLLIGSTLSALIGPLALFALLMFVALPASWPLLVKKPKQALLTVAIFALSAAPQVARTTIGIASGDDFLTYRQASTQDLGISPIPALIAAIPILLIASVSMIALFATKRSPERTSFRALLIALGVGASLMTFNDLWGFTQEPYRFWLQYSIVTLLLLSVITPWSVQHWPHLSLSWKAAVAVMTTASVALWALSLEDFKSFFMFAQEQSVISVDDDRSRAIQKLVSRDAGLVLSSVCVDPQVMKLISGARVVSFNRGLAWPDKRSEIDLLLDTERVREADPGVLTTIGINSVLTDSACPDDWAFRDARVQPIDVMPYQGGLFTLWHVTAPR